MKPEGHLVSGGVRYGAFFLKFPSRVLNSVISQNLNECYVTLLLGESSSDTRPGTEPERNGGKRVSVLSCLVGSQPSVGNELFSIVEMSIFCANKVVMHSNLYPGRDCVSGQDDVFGGGSDISGGDRQESVCFPGYGFQVGHFADVGLGDFFAVSKGCFDFLVYPLLDFWMRSK